MILCRSAAPNAITSSIESSRRSASLIAFGLLYLAPISTTKKSLSADEKEKSNE
jgi:hypothetical protein